VEGFEGRCDDVFEVVRIQYFESPNRKGEVRETGQKSRLEMESGKDERMSEV
jgi:hypothetical protein